MKPAAVGLNRVSIRAPTFISIDYSRVSDSVGPSTDLSYFRPMSLNRTISLNHPGYEDERPRPQE